MSNDLDLKLQLKFTPAELEEIRTIMDPVLWAEKYLYDPMKPDQKLQLRWYQKEILHSRSLRKVIRCGRRSGKSVTLIVEILWKLYTKKYRKIVLITPYQSQIDELWDVLSKMIDNCTLIRNSIKRKISNPKELELYNGSQLKCFTAGSKSSSKGTNIRSLSAHDIYLDEADYLGEEALTAIEPLLITTKETTLWASSTPTGRREIFWKWCTMSKQLGFEPFHYSSSVSPEWLSISDAKKLGLDIAQSSEYYFRTRFTESQYQREIEAEFGDEEEGVFKNIFLDKNVYDLGQDGENFTKDRYDPCYTINPKNTYVMGIDWNKSLTGTQIVISEYLNQATPITIFEDRKKVTVNMQDKYRLFYRESLSSKEDSQLYSVGRIIQLLEYFQRHGKIMDHIYCDAGYGSTNIELLHEHGKSHPELGLDKRLVAIDFGSRVDILDPLTKRIEKKLMKPYIIYTVVNEIEKELCILPAIENDDGKLISQIRNFTIKRHSSIGVPVFSQGNDHILIAWLLSIIGFHFEYSTFMPYRGQEPDSIAKIRNPAAFVPSAATTERTNINESGAKSLFKNVTLFKPMVNGNKVTIDPGFYKDTEQPESYNQINNSSPWAGNISKINLFRPMRSGNSSPSGRKLIE